MRKPLFHFLAIGLLLFIAGRLFASEGEVRAPIEIDAQQIAEMQGGWARRIGGTPSSSQLEALIRQAVDDEILFREAVAAGMLEADSVVQRRLIQNARFLGLEDASDEALLEQAFASDMHLTDPVVRRRLIQLMRSAVFAGARAEQVADEEQQLLARYEAERDRFVTAPRVRIAHVFVGRDGGVDDDARANALREQIVAADTSIDAAIRLGDPFLRGHRLALLSQRELEGYFGPGLAQQVFEVDVGEWSRPIESAYGLHLVFVEQARAAKQQPYDEVRKRLRNEWVREREKARLRRVLDELRADYEIRVAAVPQGKAS